MQTLNLYIEHCLCVHLDAKRRLYVVRKAFFVALFDHRPLLLEAWVIDELEQTFKLVQVPEPHFSVNLERLGDEVGEKRVALVEPATRSD